jgi:hypothetical protein
MMNPTNQNFFEFFFSPQRENRTLKFENLAENHTDYSDVTSRIVGGWNSHIGEYPFMVKINFKRQIKI